MHLENYGWAIGYRLKTDDGKRPLRYDYDLKYDIPIHRINQFIITYHGELASVCSYIKCDFSAMEGRGAVEVSHAEPREYAAKYGTAEVLALANTPFIKIINVLLPEGICI